MSKYVNRPVTDSAVASLGRWLRIQIRRSKRFGYCAEATSVYLTDKLFDLGLHTVRDLWIPKELNFAEVELAAAGRAIHITVSV